MSAQFRAAISKLELKYARHFDVPLRDVESRTNYKRGDVEVHCPLKPDLPVWSLGTDDGPADPWQEDRSGRKLVSR